MKSSRTETRKPATQRIELIALTRREVQVLALLKQEKTSREIGASLGIAEGTVNFWVGRLNNRYGVHNRHELMHKFSHDPWLAHRKQIHV